MVRPAELTFQIWTRPGADVASLVPETFTEVARIGPRAAGATDRNGLILSLARCPSWLTSRTPPVFVVCRSGEAPTPGEYSTSGRRLASLSLAPGRVLFSR